MSTYTIGEVAERSGFSASALRYYESIGLVSPTSRTDGGYRMYDDHALARLAFVDRAKRLGCSLEEIRDLVGLWEGDRCGPVQRRLHRLVTAKIADARRQIAELAALADQLGAAAVLLDAPPTDGPCGEDCACLAAPPGARTADAPIVCTLEASALPERLADWGAVLDHAAIRTTAPDGVVRVAFDGDLSLADLARVVAAEQACCAFLSFAITVDGRGVALEVRAPDGAAGIVESLFGLPA